jgi:hypothetical protein
MSEEKKHSFCECHLFETDWDMVRQSMLNNGHHPNCQHFRCDGAGAIALLSKLADGISYWASQEDGVPDEVWDAYTEAMLLGKNKKISRVEAT